MLKIINNKKRYKQQYNLNNLDKNNNGKKKIEIIKR